MSSFSVSTPRCTGSVRFGLAQIPTPCPFPAPPPAMLRSVCFRFLKRPWRRLHWLSPLATAVVMVTGPAAPMAWRRLPALPAAGHPALRLRGALLRPPPSWGAINGSNLDPLSLSCGAVEGAEVSKLSQTTGSPRWRKWDKCALRRWPAESTAPIKSVKRVGSQPRAIAVQRIPISWPHCWGSELRGPVLTGQFCKWKTCKVLEQCVHIRGGAELGPG